MLSSGLCVILLCLPGTISTWMSNLQAELNIILFQRTKLYIVQAISEITSLLAKIQLLGMFRVKDGSVCFEETILVFQLS